MLEAYPSPACEKKSGISRQRRARRELRRQHEAHGYRVAAETLADVARDEEMSEAIRMAMAVVYLELHVPRELLR